MSNFESQFEQIDENRQVPEILVPMEEELEKTNNLLNERQADRFVIIGENTMVNEAVLKQLIENYTESAAIYGLFKDIHEPTFGEKIKTNFASIFRGHKSPEMLSEY